MVGSKWWSSGVGHRSAAACGCSGRHCPRRLPQGRGGLQR